ncbi:demethylrebeccamycin-D-glucose O-methyltransferase [Variibacter gotjawalensis]|uniref:Demethylrebeccamycin-D-glucose O-methyltransferase n=1 Tax=Variibacter gotjawalensis TaxID=1333996 RepID=A0A0S3PV06_9BRAD|nr:class I SAM-dependent methyltransferase [Variibacter gotjawalensis]NIK50081.1 S-adenosylmethionine-diacylgycerolhomoserine-N-methyltransferase [Variibacter gotjawalensis]RZS46080.1 S-adenosylmethionine-diacylgycerolhomoserine-N-methyltransferase [Variibacter gotjawalensis]BAT59755.1 demethylrebeccamycin-D-glucose O-methyltransferase [Variibacter gotjawalensis]
MAILDTPQQRMDRMYAGQRHIYDLTRKFYLLGRDRLIDRLAPPHDGHVIEIGCGTGRNLIRAARQHPQAHFVGLDVSTEMLRSAQKAITRAGVGSRVRVAYADATMLNPTRQHQTFDRAFLSYSLSMIPEWRRVLEATASLLGPHGELHVVDFGDQRDLPAWSKPALRGWLKLFDVTPRDDLGAEMELLAFRFRGTAQVEAIYGGYAQYGVLKLRA